VFAVLIGIDASRAASAQRTGTENYSLQLIRALLGLGSDHQFRLYTSSTPPAGLFGTGEPPGASEIRVIPFPRLWTHVRLSAEMLARPPDVLFVPAHVLPLFHPRRSVVTVHDMGFLFHPHAHRRWDRQYLRWSTNWNARQAMAVLADSEATRGDLLRACPVDGAKVKVVYLGRDEGLAPVVDVGVLAEVRSRYGIPGRYLLYLGTLQPRKNLERLVEAFARVAGEPILQDVDLVLAGKRGWLYDSLFARVSRLGLEGRVHFSGYVSDADIAALYSGASAYIFPSLYEGFGMPVLEAQSCGVPVVTSNNSSLPEVAGNAALLVDPTDGDAIASAIRRVVADEALRAELIRRGFENVKRFSWQKCAQETLAVLESVATPHSQGPSGARR